MNGSCTGSGPRRVLGHVRDDDGAQRLLVLASNLDCAVDIRRRAAPCNLCGRIHRRNRVSQRLLRSLQPVKAGTDKALPHEAGPLLEFYDLRSWKELVRRVRDSASPQRKRAPSIHCLILESRCLAMLSNRQRLAMGAAVEAADVVIACGDLGEMFPPWALACVDVKCPDINSLNSTSGYKQLAVEGNSRDHEKEWLWSRRQFGIAIELATKVHVASVGPMQRRVGWLCARPEHYFVHLLRRFRNDSRVSLIVGYQRGGRRWRLVCAVALRRVDVLIVNGWGRISALLVMGLARSVGVPYAIVSDTWLGTAGRSSWYAFSSSLAREWVVRGAYRLLPAGRPQAEYLSTTVRRFVPAEKMEILHFGVDSERIKKLVDAMPLEIAKDRREQWGVGTSDVMVLYVGKLEGNKGADRLPAIALGVARHSDRVKFVVVGDGEFKGLMTREAEGTLPIMYLGPSFGIDVIEALGCADIVLLPSRKEQWGLIVNEALSAGVPVVVTERVGCAADLVRPKCAGIVAKDAIPNIVDGVLKLVDMSDVGVEYGERGRKWIDGWNIDVMYEVVCRVCGVGGPVRMAQGSGSVLRDWG